jgi:hypothetical protein
MILSDLSDAPKGKPNVKIRPYSHSIKSKDSSTHHDSFIRVARMSYSVIGYRLNPIRGDTGLREADLVDDRTAQHVNSDGVGGNNV